MPLTQAQKDLISKVQGGADILAVIDVDETEHVTLKDTNKTFSDKIKTLETTNRSLTKEQVARKRAQQNVAEAAKAHGLELFGGEFGLEPPIPLDEQFESIIAKSGAITKDVVTKSPDYVKLEKTVKDLQTKIEEADKKTATAEAARKTERIRSVLQGATPTLFDKNSPYVVDLAISKGQAIEDENGVICLKDGDNIISSADKDAFATTLRKFYPELAVIKPKGGSGDTPARGGSPAKEGRVTYKEFKTINLQQQQVYMQKVNKEGGEPYVQ